MVGACWKGRWVMKGHKKRKAAQDTKTVTYWQHLRITNLSGLKLL